MNTLPYLALHILNSAWYRLLAGTVDTDAMHVIEGLQNDLIDQCQPLGAADVVGLLGFIRAYDKRGDLPEAA